MKVLDRTANIAIILGVAGFLTPMAHDWLLPQPAPPTAASTTLIGRNISLADD